MAIWAWFKPETAAKSVRKRVLLSISVWKVVLVFLIKSKSKHDFMNVSDEENSISPTHLHIAEKSEFYSHRGPWVSS